ncbi:GATA transcription factor 12-like [Cucurbita moschata]|uniref:GATA transcription factor n=1 Tax=Cucurbita moschata TaxID=3662 RepID=A0A6J1HCI3_CUCMO|nr:GATA transcription factor 12-like [Cucurbita moschata]
MEPPEFVHLKAYTSTHSSSDQHRTAAAEHDLFFVENLLDFSNHADADADADHADAGLLSDNSNNNHHNINTPSCFHDNGNSAQLTSFLDHVNLPDAHFSAELAIPYDELLELEWLSNFVEECEYIQNLELITGVKVKPHEPTAVSTRNAAAIFNPDVVSVPAKARSKRSRAVVSNWNNSLLLPLSPTTSSSESDINAEPPQLVKKAPPKAVVTAKKKDSPEGGVSPAGEERRCMHCATNKTPQWRTGPMGPKTLCNACGVRYKSGRLVPEYRPAASPTFVLTRHSNSHRKVMELRRQKEILRGQQQPQQLILDHHRQDLIFDASSCDNYLIHHVGPDFRQLI